MFRDITALLGAEVLAACFIIDLPDLGGAGKLRKFPVRTLIAFEGRARCPRSDACGWTAIQSSCSPLHESSHPGI